MKLKNIFLLLLFGILNFTFGQVSPDSSQVSALNELHGKYKKNIQINWNKTNGAPDIITFSKPIAFDNSQEKSVVKFLKAIEKLIKYRTRKDTLELISQDQNKGTKYFRFQQKYKGLNIKGGEYIVTVLQDGSIQTALGFFYKDLEMDTQPRISLNEALKVAINNSPKGKELKEYIYSHELLIYPKDGFYYLAYELHIPTIRKDESWCYIIDATTGKILLLNSDTINENFNLPPESQANVYLHHPGIDASYTLISPLSNLNNNGYLQGTYAYILNDKYGTAYNASNDFAYTTGSTHFDEANLYYHIDRFRSIYLNNLGFNSFIQITAHAYHDFYYFNNPDPNASYDLNDHHLRFSDGQGVTGYNSFAREDKIIYHEYTHAVTDYRAHLTPGYSESGAIHEGNSDYFAGSFTGRSLSGEYANYGYSINQRNMTNPRIANYTQYNDISYYLGYPLYEPHFGGELWSSCLWNLRSNIFQTYADQLIFNGLSSIPTNSTFLQYRSAIIIADAAYSNVHTKQIENTFASRGIGVYHNMVVSIAGPSSLSCGAEDLCRSIVSDYHGNLTYEWREQVDGQSAQIIGTSENIIVVGRCDGKGRWIYLTVNDPATGEWKNASIRIESGGGFAIEPKDDFQSMLSEQLPTDYALRQNNPNPFNPTTTINYQLPENGFVTIKVYDMLGKEVAVLVNENKSVGYYRVYFNASKLTSGVYLYTITANNFIQSKKMLLMK